MPLDWSPLWLSLRYAGLATVLASAIALPLAWLLARRRFPGSQLLDAAANLPLAVPTAVLVYYLLARAAQWGLVFRWRAAVAVSAVYTLPLIFRMFRGGLATVDAGFENAARSLGASEWRVFSAVTAPLAWRALLAAVMAGFARAAVDFGMTAAVAVSASAWIAAAGAVLGLAILYAGNRVRA